MRFDHLFLTSSSSVSYTSYLSPFLCVVLYIIMKFNPGFKELSQYAKHDLNINSVLPAEEKKQLLS